MRAGKLRQRLMVDQATVTRDALGAPVYTWNKVGERWAGLEPLSGREFFSAQQLQSDVTHRVTIRYDHDLDPMYYRFRYQGRIFNIDSVLNIDERNREMQCMCREEITGASP